MKNSKWFLLSLAGLFLTGCSLDASILQIELPNAPAPTVTFEKPGGAEFVSGASPDYQTTPILGYKVQASVGHFIAEPRIETVGRGYIVYSSVQGNMISEQISP
jgi:hypothetical protein